MAFLAVGLLGLALTGVGRGATPPVSGLLREVWEGIPGTDLASLTGSPAYPDNPTSTNYVTDLFEAPTDALDNYGQRMHGYVLPPLTGAYTFWISSDDDGALYLSTDEHPANVRLIASVSGWTSPREWTKFAPQQSVAVPLTAGRPYYIAAFSKEGGGGDNLAVRWRMPDGTDQGPIVATNLIPYGISFSPPVIVQEPTNTTVLEGEFARFSVTLSGVGLYSFRWQRNGTLLPGAEGPELVYGPAQLSDQNARFRCVVSNDLGVATSAEAVLGVTPDTTPPTLVGARNLGRNQVEVTFSETVTPATALNPDNYRLTGGVGITDIQPGAEGRIAILNTAALTYGQTYTLTVNRVVDLAGTPNVIAPNSQVSFVAAEFTPSDVGAPALAGGTVSVPGGVDVTGAGRTIGGTADQFQFGWQERTGNFDVQARVAEVTITDAFLQAGLMARESLEGNVRFAAVFASSPQLGCYFSWRPTTGANASTAAPRGGFPVNYPHTWLRLQRVGNTLTGYASFEGTVWTQLGTATLTGLPTSLYLGFAVSSDNERLLATARFRDYSPTVSTASGTPQMTREPVGPSSRATGMIFSELMYQPAPRDDGRNLEFVELHNARSVFEDLTGWKLAGVVGYAFPAGYQMQAGETVVVAASPEDVRAVYGLTNVLGPYTGSLPDSGGQLRLLNNAGAIRLEVNYADRSPWPVSPDGAGHSLVLARPSFGEDDVRAWEASEFRGGSPGQLEPTVPTPETNVLINEFLAHTDLPTLDFVELYNRSNERVDLSGMVLTDRAETNRFRIPEGTFIEPRGYQVWDESQLGFALDAAGEALYLINAAGTRVLDAVRFGAQENGVSSGRSPDGHATIRRLSQPTPGATNARWRLEDVVINELMFNPISGEDDDEYLELFNRTPDAISLAGWRLVAGVDFTFPDHARLPGNGYLVVGRNAARLRANYPQLNAANCVGDYAGQLSNRGERVALARPEEIVSVNASGFSVTNRVQVVVSEVTYADGGRWGTWADGGGSSLELVDPRADLLQASSWADSDETAKAPWTTVEFTGRVDNANGGANRLHLGMLGAGECLVDDVEAFRAGSTNVVNNGDFENGNTGWTFSGNHSTSTVDTAGAAGGTRCLHIRAQGDGDTGPNTLRNALRTTLTGNQNVTLRAKVRWLAGWPQILFRLRGNGLEMAADFEIPSNLGTPALPNSRRVANAGPAIYEVTHNPPLPTTNATVRVTCRVSDPDGVSSVMLRYRTDPATTFTTLAMRDDGALGDEVAGDGLFSALLPGRNAGTLVAFRITATDAAAQPVSTTFPSNDFTWSGAQGQECLVRWGDTIPFGTFAHYHLWFTQAVRNARQNALDNTWRDATLVYGNQRVIYNTGFRDKGSPYHGGSGDIAATTPRDEALLGTFDRVFASTGNGGSEQTGIRSQLAAWYAQQLGIPYLHAHYMRLYFNGSLFRPDIMEDLEQPNHEYAERWFGAEDTGDLYKIAVWFEFNDDNRGFQATGATTQRFTTTGGAYKLARYRWNWQRRSNDQDANNYAQFFDLVTALNDTSNSYVNNVLQQANLEQWMRAFCFDYAMGNWDVWTYNVGQNMYLYRPLGERWVLLPWDIDFVFGLGDGASNALRGGGQDPIMSRAYSNPTFLRMNWRAYQDTINGPFLAANFQPQIDARRTALLRNSVVGISSPTSITSWINSRRNFINTQLNNADSRVFEITSNGGADFESPNPTTILTGAAPIAVATLEVNGIPYPVTWTSVRNFSLTVPLTQATNQLTLVGKDLRGNMVPGATDSVTVRYAGLVERPEDFVVFNEVHYDAADDEPASTFIEFFNRSSTTPFDLSGWVVQGVGYTFPAGAILAPGAYLVLVGDRPGFEAVYGRNVPIFDTFSGSLDNDGERLALIRPSLGGEAEEAITEVRYWHRLPWPTNAAGLGPSLQLVDPAQGSWRVGNWAATATNATNRATPGRLNSVAQTLVPFPPVWLNEVQPNNVTGPLDAAGDRDPWIELYNAGTNVVDLTGYALTDRYDELSRWRFPAGTTLGPRQFLLIWADGEPGESRPGEPHASFRLAPSTGSVALTRSQGSPPTSAVMDYLEYELLSAGRSLGSYPDGDPRRRRQFVAITPGAPNDPALPTLSVRLNEFMASNTRTLTNNVGGAYDDWFELYNAAPTSADLSGYTLTDTFDSPGRFTIPSGTVVPPNGFLLVWADNQPGLNAPGTDLHVNFALSLGGEQLGLFDPDGQMVDGFSFGPQTSDVSLGRYPDGAELPLYEMVQPTPRQPNFLEGGNRPPVFAAVSDQSAEEATPLRFTVQATDPDPGQSVRYSLGPEAPPAATIHEVTGAFEWTPAEADGPGRFNLLIVATDNGTPSRSGTLRVGIEVAEVNQPPVLEAIPDQVTDESTLFTLQLATTDPDLPRQQLRFTLDPDAPEGATLTDEGGFSWTPPETMGGQTVTVGVRVTDNGQPPLSNAQTFRITVVDTPSPPTVPFIEPQFVDEGTTFRYQVIAFDADTPPSPLRFTFDQAPTEAVIAPDTGWITWPTAEADGPTNTIFLVRVTELDPPYLSTARTFSVAVRELNQPPVLAPIASRVVPEGSWLVITNVATDPDLPPQQLNFSLAPGAPAGAAVDPLSGRFTWLIGADAGPSTNVITIQVTDDAEDAKSASQSHTVIVVAEPKIVINEIMYNPGGSGAAYVELHNVSTNTAWDMSGWLLTGTRYLLPAGTRLAPSGFVVVAGNTNQFIAAYGARTNLLGNYVNQLGAGGGTIELYRSMTGSPETLVDRVTFRSSAPWPVAANGSGPSLQLLDPTKDNSRVANWAALAAATTNVQVNVVPIDGAWRYWQAAADPPSDWAGLSFNDTAWSSGKALLYAENADLPAAKNTPLTLGQMSYFFRTTFNASGAGEGSLVLRPVLDDGAVVYLNGQPIFWLGMPEGVIPQRSTAANRTVGDAVFEGPFTIPVTNLRAGENVLAIEVHQVNTGSSDVVMGVSVDLIEVRRESFTPGYANSVRTTLEPFPDIGLNEVLALNQNGIRDNVGDRDPWIELANYGGVPVTLDGWSLSDNYAALNRWTFPSGAALGAGQLKLVWADAEPGESTAVDWHANFRLPAPDGIVVLSRMQQGQPAVVDFLEYAGLTADVSFGYPASPRGDSVPGILGTPTPGTPNGVPPVITEIALGAEGQVSLRWTATPGRTYRVEASAALEGEPWRHAGQVTASGSEAGFTDPSADPAHTSAQYYRILLLP